MLLLDTILVPGVDEMARPGQYLYQLQPTRLAMLTEGTTVEEDETISRHFAYLCDLEARSILILAGRTLNTDETTFGIVIFNADSDQAALDTMNNDPSVSGGVMRARLYPYRVALISEANAG
jgi:uncharacterized protein YciI